MFLNRDVSIVQISATEELIIATDNSGSIGEEEADDVSVPYDVVTYYNFRVAYMECVAAGGEPLAVIVHNFSGDHAWDPQIEGIKRGMEELSIQLEITGSTESNFPLKQSAVGLVVIGKRQKKQEKTLSFDRRLKIAIIGTPLVGDAVVERQNEIAPLAIFQQLIDLKQGITILPVGSKGISFELRQLFPTETLSVTTSVPLNVSAGPATCFIIVYHESLSAIIKNISASFFHPVQVKT